MRVLLLLFFAAVDYYVVLVFFKQKSRRNASTSLLWLIGYLIGSKLVTSALSLTAAYPYNIAQSALLSILLVLLVAFFCQLVAIMIDRTINWHREHNKANLHRQPIRFAIERQAQLTSLATYFYFLASLVMLWGVWLGPIGPTL